MQVLLDTVYEKPKVRDRIVPFYSKGTKLLLRMIASLYTRKGKNQGMVVVISDLSDLMDYKDAVKSLQIIQDLNNKLEIRNKLLDETFGRFLSDEIVRQLLDTPDGLALGGNKRELTIMMSDLRGFTALSERMKAEDLICMLNHYLGEIIEKYQFDTFYHEHPRTYSLHSFEVIAKSLGKELLDVQFPKHYEGLPCA